MQTSVGKATRVELKAGNSAEAHLTKVGDNASGRRERKARAQSANSAFNSTQRAWLRKAWLSVEAKTRLYSSCVQSRLLHNAGASAYKRAELDKLDAAHRRRLRRVLGVLYPEHISNEETYSRANATLISI